MTYWRLAQPGLREEVLTRIPQRTIGSALSDVVSAAAFFASDEAQRYCNGAAIFPLTAAT